MSEQQLEPQTAESAQSEHRGAHGNFIFNSLICGASGALAGFLLPIAIQAITGPEITNSPMMMHGQPVEALVFNKILAIGFGIVGLLLPTLGKILGRVKTHYYDTESDQPQ